MPLMQKMYKSKLLRDWLAKKHLLPLFKKIGIRPEPLVIFRIVFAIITGVLIITSERFYSVLFLSIYQVVFLLDYIDGDLAKYHKVFSVKWNIFDRISHHIISIFFLVAVAFTFPIETIYFKLGLLGGTFLLLNLFVEQVWIMRKKIALDDLRGPADSQGVLTPVYSFLPIDGTFTIFYWLFLFNFEQVLVGFYCAISLAILIKKAASLLRMRDKQKVKKTLGRFYSGHIAESYDFRRINDIRQKDVLDREKEIVKSFLEKAPKGNILDVACGTGIMFPSYGKRDVYGVDISGDMLALAQKRAPSAKLKIADAENLPFRGNFFSVVITSRFLCHTPAYKKVFSEMVRVTKPGGALIVDFFNKNSLAYPTTKIRLMTGKLRYFNLLNYKEIQKLAKRHNLKIDGVKSKVFLPTKIFPKFSHRVAKKINSKLSDLMPRLSNPMYVMFLKVK